MPASVETLLFCAYTAIAAGLAVHAGLAAASHRHSGSSFTRALVALISFALLPTFGLACLAHHPENGALELAMLGLPVLSGGCAIVNARLLAHVGFGGRLLVSTTVAWNMLLTFVYAVRALAELYSFEFGSASTLTLIATSLTQSTVGAENAVSVPVWLWLPVLVSPKYDGAGGITSRTLGGLASSSMCGVLGMAVLPALDLMQTSDTRAANANLEIAPRGDIATSIQIGDETWSRGFALPAAVREIAASSIELDIERATSLGVREVEFAFRADLANDGDAIARIQDAVRTARRAGLEIAIRCVAPPPGAVPMHPRRFEQRMQHAHWILTERLEPDTIILFDRPYGAATRDCVGVLGAKKWVEIVRKAVRQMAEGKPRQRCAVALAPPHPKSREVWSGLSTGLAPHEFRFCIEGNSFRGEGAARASIAVAGWLAENPSRFSVAFVASPPTPLSFGSEAHRRYFERLIAVASGQRSVSRLVLGPLRNGRRGLNGLWTSRSQPRATVEWLHSELAKLGTAAKPASTR